MVAGARVKLTRTADDQSLSQEVLSGGDGQFLFANIAPGPFQITITSRGFATQISSGTLHSGENYIVPPLSLVIATNVTDMEVGVSQTEVAEEQIKVERETACARRPAKLLCQLRLQRSSPHLETKV